MTIMTTIGRLMPICIATVLLTAAAAVHAETVEQLYEKAKAEMLQSLAIRPNTPEILNSLGSTQLKLGDKAGALASFEKAVSLRPNYAIARFNLAETIEPTNPKRALSEYETYLALVEGIPEEADRIALVQQRVKKLRPQK